MFTILVIREHFFDIDTLIDKLTQFSQKLVEYEFHKNRTSKRNILKKTIQKQHPGHHFIRV